MFPEEDLIPISGLQHLAFCERQWALVHLEDVWRENRLTVEGRHMHEQVHEGNDEQRGDRLVTRGLRINSLRLGLSGVADVVEFHRQREDMSETIGTIRLRRRTGMWKVVPIEFKRGRPKSNKCDEIQLCAQALCLEEMLGAEISEGALFYGRTRRRQQVSFESNLRDKTKNLSMRAHQLMESGSLPRAVVKRACKRCSLLELCLPGIATGKKSAMRYLNEMIESEVGD